MKFLGNNLGRIDLFTLIMIVASIHAWWIEGEGRTTIPVLAPIFILMWVVYHIRLRKKRKLVVKDYAAQIVDHLLKQNQ